jgi:hypothetical protein
MKNHFFAFLCILLGNVSINAQNLHSPSEFLGYELGSQFSRHHKVVDYFKYISDNSKNIEFEEYGKTNENRSLNVAFISSEKNIQNLESIQKDNLKRTGILKGNATSEIAIVWLSYNIHGNEASSTEAAMQTIYELVTNKQDWLRNTLVIIDPCINPDGRDRYVNWYNQIKSTPFNTNPDVTEHNEPWPKGRANHYLFDLNRDWAWATQVETQQRLKVYNKWMPHVHVDYHEQWINNPYYFAPAAEPFHEIITDWQRDFQTQIGKNHAKYFDENGWRYFTKESFDLLYPSYGDTFPTYMGAIGMTYEQAGHGKAGLGILTENNTVLTLKDRITHHTTTGLSTVEMASINAGKLVSEFKNYFDNTGSKNKSFILRGPLNKIMSIGKLLDKHEISYYPAKEKTIKAYDYETKSTKNIKTSNKDWIVSMNQPKGKMVKVLFEPEVKLSDSVTYDITAWSIPFAYGVKGFSTEAVVERDTDYHINGAQSEMNKHVNKVYAYVQKWSEVSDAELLGNLLQEGFNVRFSRADFSVENKKFKSGALIILRGENKHIPNFNEIIAEIGNRLHKKPIPVNTGFVDSGFDFGSSKVSLIKNKKVAVLSGEGTSSLSFGEIWHFFETQLHYPLHVINTKNLNSVDSNKYDVLILPNGFKATKDQLIMLTDYANTGGSIISIGSSLKSFADKEGFLLKTKKDSTNGQNNKDQSNLIAYNLRSRESISNSITGSIFKSNIDNTHPLAFGYENKYYSLKLSSKSYHLLEKGVNVGHFSENATSVSGFAGKKALRQVPNSLLFGVENKGKGKIIYMVDNPLYRSFWENGKLFFANAIFLN